ncbi:hypothetical protein [Streptomyces sp. NPDC053048]|uniref:hypothetical protein n=1 Tax=Streptomyces sp. NPDC053048 TaxID=3365694 RepID=UPI0037D40F11
MRDLIRRLAQRARARSGPRTPALRAPHGTCAPRTPAPPAPATRSPYRAVMTAHGIDVVLPSRGQL